MNDLKSIIRELITANHILHHHAVVDAYGHISVRHPDDPSLFILSGNRAPALVSSASDLIHYHVSDASPADGDAPKGYIERYIHSEIYKRFSHVNCVIHAHSEDVLVYANSGVPLRPTFHMPAFLGQSVPVWDIENAYKENDAHDTLVRSQQLGADLALQFSREEHRATSHADPDLKVVLMRKHGFTTLGKDIRSAVFYAIFTTAAARVQTNATLLRNAFGSMGNSAAWRTDAGDDDNNGDQVYACAFEPLSAKQAADTEELIGKSMDRPWGLWVAEVQASPLYANKE